jgi:subtilase family serine protease
MDYNATSGLYEGTIPAQAYGVTVKYSVSAGDNVDNNAIRDNSELYYSYPVIPEFSPVILTATFALLSLSATVFAKKRAKKVI